MKFFNHLNYLFVYNILEAHLEYKAGKLGRVTVLVEISHGDIRAISATDTPRPGYEWLQPGEPVNEDLLQRVAAYGMRVHDRDTVFTNWKERQAPGAGQKKKKLVIRI